MPVGGYGGKLAEVHGSRRTRWISELNRAGWHVIRVYRGPFIVGEMTVLCNDMCARVGLCTENIYVARKDGCRSPHESFFADFIRRSSGSAEDMAIVDDGGSGRESGCREVIAFSQRTPATLAECDWQ